ncbi:tail fiber protein [Paenibacillus sp. 481]|uniref:tail fiber protein n=1 Tax=Paenibacillus sp. 481 TaxID=2835869 RepID=UPI0022B4E937|nr:tail fiber protein [Paenibacillus sp. 481]UHA74452.1 tail fiber protein [Paenibacillus sp. 481]
MAAFNGFTLTQKGRNLHAKAQTGVQLRYTRFALGDGQLGTSDPISLNRLISEKKSLGVAKLALQGEGKAVVGTVITNKDIVAGFYLREIGIFAQDPTEGEILYAYANSGQTAEFLPPGGGPDVIEKALDAILIINGATNVVATIDASLVWAKPEEIAAAEIRVKQYTELKIKEVTVTSIGAAPAQHSHTAEALPKATVTTQGIVQLIDSVTSTALNLAPTASALKKVYDEAALAKQYGNDAKAAVVASLIAKGMPATINNTWAELAAMVRQIQSGPPTVQTHFAAVFLPLGQWVTVTTPFSTPIGFHLSTYHTGSDALGSYQFENDVGHIRANNAPTGEIKIRWVRNGGGSVMQFAIDIEYLAGSVKVRAREVQRTPADFGFGWHHAGFSLYGF